MGIDPKEMQQAAPGCGLGCVNTFIGIPMAVVSIALCIQILFHLGGEKRYSPRDSTAYDRLTDDEQLQILDRLIGRLGGIEKDVEKFQTSIQAFEDHGGFEEGELGPNGRNGFLHQIWLARKKYRPPFNSLQLTITLGQLQESLESGAQPDGSHRLLARDAEALDELNFELGVGVLGAASFDALIDPNFRPTSGNGLQIVLNDLRTIDTALSAANSR